MRLWSSPTSPKEIGMRRIIPVLACVAVLAVYAAYAFRDAQFGYRGIMGTAVGLGAYIGLLGAIASTGRRRE